MYNLYGLFQRLTGSVSTQLTVYGPSLKNLVKSSISYD